MPSPLADVREVVVEAPPMTHLPTAPPVVRGIFNLRGDIVPLLDTALLLGLHPVVEEPYAVLVETGHGVAGLVATGMPATVRLNKSVGHSDLEGTTETYLIDATPPWPSASTSPRSSAPGHGSRSDPLLSPLSEGDFQRLFATEAEGRLDSLVDELLELERGGSDPELLASLFREAHTIKGGAAVVGMDHVARVAHALEDLLEEVRQDRRGVDAPLIDAVLAGVDAIRTLIPLAVAGEDHGQAAADAERRLRIALGGDPARRRRRGPRGLFLGGRRPPPDPPTRAAPPTSRPASAERDAAC